MSPRPPAARAGVAGVLLAGLALLLVAIVWGELHLRAGGVDLRLSYKTLARALAVLGMAALALPQPWAALRPRFGRSDVALALFALAAALSVAAGGGHWGDVRNLAAAIALGWLACALFAPPARRALFLHYFGALVCLVLARELLAHPDLLPPRVASRYELVTANPNTLGFLFAMVAPLLLAEALAARGGRRAWAAFYCAAAVAGTLVTLSRTAAAGLTLGALIVVVPLGRRAWIAALGVAALAAYLLVARSDVWSSEGRRGDADRLRIMATSLTLAAESPLLGVGFGINNLEERFPARYEARYGARLFRFHSMNQVVDLLAGTGIVGTALAAWWIAQVAAGLRAGVRAAPPGPVRIRAVGGLAAAAAIALMSMADTPLYHGKLVPILFLVLAYARLDPQTCPK